MDESNKKEPVIPTHEKGAVSTATSSSSSSEEGSSIPAAEQSDVRQEGEGAGTPPSLSFQRVSEHSRQKMQKPGKLYISWPHMAALIFMLITLILLLFYKDRCGQTVSQSIFFNSNTPENKGKANSEMGTKADILRHSDAQILNNK